MLSAEATDDVLKKLDVHIERVRDCACDEINRLRQEIQRFEVMHEAKGTSSGASSSMTAVPSMSFAPSKSLKAMQRRTSTDSLVEDAKEGYKKKFCAEPVAYDVTHQYYTEGWAQAIARNHWFEHITLAVVCFNGLWMAIDVDFNDGNNENQIWHIMDNFFCFYFTAELVIRFLSFRHKPDCLHDKWFTFDLVLVSLMILETWLLELYAALTGISLGSGSSAQVLRLLRLLRLTRMAKTMRSVPELMILTKGTIVGIRSVFITLVLLGGITLVFAIGMRSLTDGTDVGAEAFTTVPFSAYTLIIQGVIPDNGDLMTSLMETNWFFSLMFFVFIFLAALTFMNMLIGILCEAVHGVSCSEREENDIHHLKHDLRYTFSHLDTNFSQSQEVDLEMFLAALEKEHIVKSLDKLDVNIPSLMDHSEVMFAKGHICFREFLDETLKFRATDMSMSQILFDIRTLCHTHFSGITKNTEDGFERLEYILHRSGDGVHASIDLFSGTEDSGVTGGRKTLAQRQFGQRSLRTTSLESLALEDHDVGKTMSAPLCDRVLGTSRKGKGVAASIIGAAFSGCVRLPGKAKNYTDPHTTRYTATDGVRLAQNDDSSAEESSQDPSNPSTGNVQAASPATGDDHAASRARIQCMLNDVYGDNISEDPTNLISVRFGEEVHRLGFAVSWEKGNHPVAEKVSPGGAAAGRGVRNGDVLVKINEFRTLGKCRDDLLPRLAERPLVVKLSRPSA